MRRIKELHISKKVATAGLLFATALALSWIENIIPVIPGMAPGIKMGLANIVMLFCLFFAGIPYAIILAVLKSLFVLLIKGFTAGLLSFAGGITSVAVMILMIYLSKKQCSYGFVSICGAISHNIGQLIMVFILTSSVTVFYYTPILIVSGVVMGMVTGLVFLKLSKHIDSINVF